jgi:hypothetical protein
MIPRVDGHNTFTLSDGSTFVDRCTKPINELPAEVQAEYAASALRVLRGENTTPITPMCDVLLRLKRGLAKAKRDEQEGWLTQIRVHHTMCGCGKVGIATPGNEWIWEGE